MEELKKRKTAYYLFEKNYEYKDKTLTTLYFKSNKQVEKKSRPIDLDGIRYRLNLEDGELTYYRKSDVEKSFNNSLKRTKILMNMLLEMNEFDWFCTFTFDKEKIDRTNDRQVFNAYVKYINNLKKQYPSLGYLTVPERHEDNCIHFHMLINGISTSALGLVNSGKVCCSWAYQKSKIASKSFFEKTKSQHELKDTDGLSVYNVTTFPYGFTTVTRIASRERCNSYVKKYIEKALGSTEIFKKRFYYSSNLKIPNIVTRLVGADFNTPEDIEKLYSSDVLVQNAEYKNFNRKYNILQYWIDNETKNNISSGLIPLDVQDIELPF